MTAGRVRLDQLLVDLGLAESRERAQALVMAGYVLIDGQKARKSGQSVKCDCRVALTGRLPFVSRGGLKLQGALDRFRIEVSGRICVDIGSSTGGFTDCLLQRGAARVYAIDVGAGQLDWKLRNDARVVVKESVNARYLTPEEIGEPADLVTCDVSFISLTLILPAAVRLLKKAGEMILLVKPQFEVGREQVGKGGIVRDPALHAVVCARLEDAVRACGFRTAIMESPILGAEGNREFLLYGSH
jgi:23S rRNA (cytidine1920-2'-O)/16S rRNA (cytidine1409-2'-O)-methyltransferase